MFRMIDQGALQKWVAVYLEHVREVGVDAHVAKEEGYKFKSVDTFQNNFDLAAPDLAPMLERAIEFNNLTMGQQYFPRRVLLLLAKEYPKETREILSALFDDKQPAGDRITWANKELDLLWTRRQAGKKKAGTAYMESRFLSLLLSFHDPAKYNALKATEWRAFCEYVDSDFQKPMGLSEGQKYELYQPYIEVLRTHIKDMPEISELRSKLTEGLAFKDSEYRWMTQDVIYVTARTIWREQEARGEEPSKPEQAPQAIEDEECEPQIIGERFSAEEYLENFIGENLTSLPLGGLTLYRDTSGRSGLYYPAPGVGEIDVLAVDAEGNFVVLELKADVAGDSPAAQLGRYMDWVEKNLATSAGKKVRGVIVAHRARKSLLNSLSALRFPAEVKLYRVSLGLSDFS